MGRRLSSKEDGGEVGRVDGGGIGESTGSLAREGG